MKDDPIVDEVRRHRQARAAKFNYDIDAIAEDARQRQAKSGHKLIQPPRRKPVGKTKSIA
jgi:hypothetical protein